MSTANDLAKEVGHHLAQHAAVVAKEHALHTVASVAGQIAANAGRAVWGAGGMVVVAHPTVAALATIVAANPVTFLIGTGVLALAGLAAISDE